MKYIYQINPNIFLFLFVCNNWLAHAYQKLLCTNISFLERWHLST